MAKAPRAAILAGALAAVAGTAYFVAPKEGERLTPYRDVVNKLTWCYGETHGTPKPRYTHAECLALLQDSVAQHLMGVAKCINVPLKENEWVAIGSWTYNVGVGAACGSGLVRKINAGVPASGWCPELLKWDRAGGRRVRGLTLRRQDEYRVCIGNAQ